MIVGGRGTQMRGIERKDETGGGRREANSCGIGNIENNVIEG